MENRWDDIFREHNKLILDVLPANVALRIATAVELRNMLAGNDLDVLELGVGEGDLTKFFFQFIPDLKIDALDISSEMIESAKRNLENFNVNFICEDALDYLKRADKNYEVITSCWTIHNFVWQDKIGLFKAIFDNLKSGGRLLLMDKVYPDDKERARNLFEIQNKRNLNYLPEGVGSAMVEHETQDYSDEYRMDEGRLIDVLKEIGFSNIIITDRVEREIILIAEKN